MSWGSAADAAGAAQSYPGRDHRYQVAIVGAGPSGCEAAWACTEAGLDTLLVTTSMDTIYTLLGDGWTLRPPAGTLMERLHETHADEAGRVGTFAFHRAAKQALEQRRRLHVLQSSASALRVEDGAVVGVATWEGLDRHADRVILAAGTFLAPRLRVGNVTEIAGKLSEMAYDDLWEDLVERGFEFREIELEADSGDGSLPYTVRCQVFAESEVHGHRLTRLERFYGTGSCVRGEIPFEVAAEDGRAAGRAVVSAMGHP